MLSPVSHHAPLLARAHLILRALLFIALFALFVFNPLIVSRAAAPIIPQSVRDNLQRRVDYGHVTGIVVGMINRDGRTFFSAGRVRADRDGEPGPDTIFEVGSISKGFTGTLLAEMLARGEVTLDDPVQSLLPNTVTVPSGVTAISLLDLATHRSGLPDNPTNLCSQGLNGLFSCYSIERLYEFLNGHTLAFEPGSTWMYSNLGFGLLGHALSLKTGLAYEALLRQRILDPLGLNDTGITLSDEQRSRRATPHWGVIPWDEFTMPALEAAGAILSTASDMLTFIEHLSGLQTNVLGAVATEATRRRAATGTPNLDMALGWLLLRPSNGELVWHDGSTYGQNAFVGFHRTSRVGVVVLCNNRVSTYGSVQDVGFHLLDSNLPLTAPRRPATVPPETLASYQGRYQSTNGLSFDALVRHGQLTLDFAPDASPGFTVHAESTVRFGVYELGVNGGAIFNVSGDTASLTWAQGGSSVSMNRVAVLPHLEILHHDDARFLRLTGTTGFSYDIHTSADLLGWTKHASHLPQPAEFAAPSIPGTLGFFHATLPPLE